MTRREVPGRLGAPGPGSGRGLRPASRFPSGGIYFPLINDATAQSKLCLRAESPFLLAPAQTETEDTCMIPR